MGPRRDISSSLWENEKESMGLVLVAASVNKAANTR